MAQRTDNPKASKSRKSRFLEDLDFLAKSGKGSNPASAVEIPVDRIRFDPKQPRKTISEDSLRELSESISRVGVLEPVLLRPTEKPEKYILVCGERRVRAAKLSGLSSIPAIVRELDPADIRLVQIIENVQREELSPLEIARAIDDLIRNHKLSQESVGRAIGKSQSFVSRHLSILSADRETMKALEEGRIKDAEAVTLLSRLPAESRERILEESKEHVSPVTAKTVREELERLEEPSGSLKYPSPGQKGRGIESEELPLSESREVSRRPSYTPVSSEEIESPEDDPVVVVELKTSEWRRIIERLGMKQPKDSEEIERVLRTLLG